MDQTNDIVPGFKIIKGTEINEKLLNYAENGALRGVWLGFPNIHKHYTMSLPGVTDWTGFPQSGKTQVLMEFLLNTSIFYGWKHLVYFPDVGNDIEILSDLIHKYTGKSFDKRFKNLITEEEVLNATPFILEHFKIVTKQDLKAKMNPYQFWDWAVHLKKTEGLHTASIDAWKDMDHSKEREIGRTDQYLEDVLAYRNSIAERHHLHLHTIIHPLKTEKEGGVRKAPGPYDLKGGSEWYNNGKSMITVHRPEKSGNLVEIYFNKIKPRSIGNVGIDELYFDNVPFRYYVEDLDSDSKTVKRYAIKDEYKSGKQFVDALTGPDDEDEDQVPF